MALLLAQVEPGFFINPYKLIPVVVLLLLWARLMTWADKDSETAHLPRVAVNLGLMGVGMLGFALFFFIPNFLISTLALVFLVLVCAGGYIGLRASQIGTKDLSKQFQAWLDGFKKKDVLVAEVVSEIQLLDSKGRIVAAPDEENPDHVGYMAVQDLLAEPMKKNPERIQLVPGANDQYKLTFVVDGYPFAGSTPDRAKAQAAIDFIKKSANLDPDEKRKPQKGKLKSTTGGKKKELDITTSGSSAGEALDIQVDMKSRHTFKLSALGLSAIQEAAIKDSIDVKQGIVLLSTPKGQGLTALNYAVIRAHDAYLTHIQTIERGSEQDLEGITQVKLSDKAPPAEELKQVSWVVSQEPDVIMLTSMEEPASAKELIKYVATGKKAYVALRANSALEAIATWRKYVGDDQKALKNLMMVVSGRVVRKLCPQCKVGVTPDPEQLRKMNLDPAKVTELYQERTEPMVDQKGNPIPCDVCEELRFKGRVGVYEVVIIDDEIREALTSGGGTKQLISLMRKQRMPTLQEAALELIQQGETSVKEVSRVFAATSSSSRSESSRGEKAST